MSFTVSVFWSMRSPYCYLALDRLMEIHQKYTVEIDLRPVYPIAIRNPDFFATAPKHYRPYHLLDSDRVAAYHGIPYRRPVPDPIIQDMETNSIATEQPFIRRLTRLAAAAADKGNGLEFQNRVMRLLWDGQTDGWNEGPHLADAIERAGLEPSALMQSVDTEPERFDAIIETNQAAHADAGHAGVPLFVLEGEPFFGQDRIEMLLWRAKQKGVKLRG